MDSTTVNNINQFFVYGNLLWNSALVGVIVWFLRKEIKNIYTKFIEVASQFTRSKEEAEERFKNEKAETLRIAKELSERTDLVTEQRAKEITTLSETLNRTSDEIKLNIRENRDFFLSSNEDVKQSIDKLTNRMDVANGRTGKLEAKIGEIITRCEERSKAFYQAAENK